MRTNSRVTISTFVALFALTGGTVFGQTSESPAERVTPTTESESVSDAESSAASDSKTQSTDFETTSVRGKVVWLSDGLKEYFGISTVPGAQERTLAIYTGRGELLPLVEDLRGRSFRTDERLRNKPMELSVRRYDKHPMLQILRIYEFKDGNKYIVDYWCDVCAIVMFEQGVCACCQDDNRLRHRLVEDDESENNSSDR